MDEHQGCKGVRKKYLLFLMVVVGLFFSSLRVSAQASLSVTLTWDPSPGENIASYVVYSGTASGRYSAFTNVNQTQVSLGGLQSGQTYFFAVTARDTTGEESGPSNEIIYQVPVSTNADLPSEVNAALLNRAYEATPTEPLTDDGAPAANDAQTFNVTVVATPRLLCIAESPPGFFTLEWRVYPGRTYRFQFKDSLSETNWTTLGADFTADSLNAEVMDDAGTNRFRFYRVLETAP